MGRAPKTVCRLSHCEGKSPEGLAWCVSWRSLAGGRPTAVEGSESWGSRNALIDLETTAVGIPPPSTAFLVFFFWAPPSDIDDIPMTAPGYPPVSRCCQAGTPDHRDGGGVGCGSRVPTPMREAWAAAGTGSTVLTRSRAASGRRLLRMYRGTTRRVAAVLISGIARQARRRPATGAPKPAAAALVFCSAGARGLIRSRLFLQRGVDVLNSAKGWMA